jgi:hypothetical protein
MRALSLLLVSAALGCSSPAPTLDSKPKASTDEIWDTGTKLEGEVVIPEGRTVEIAKGALIEAAPGTVIVVEGVLRASAKDKRAKITGTDWKGIAVAKDGILALEGVDLEDPVIALDIASTNAKYSHGAISYATTPFQVAAGGKLVAAHTRVFETGGESKISGAFEGSYLDYDSKGFDGFDTVADGATVTVTDSKMMGDGIVNGDMFVSRSLGQFKVSHTEIFNIHCAFHFNNVTDFDISFVSVHGNKVGFMLYGSDQSGTKIVTRSNIFENASFGVEEGGANGLITFKDGYWASNGQNFKQLTSAITMTNMSTTTPVAGVGPR